SFELAIDNLITKIVYVKDIKDKGSLSFTLPAGKKTAVIYLPADATVVVKNVQINAEAAAPTKTASVLWLGDSITQGYGPLRSACTYVSVANRILNYKIVNQGIGGYVYDKKSLMKMGDYMPEKIIVALGTNQYGTEDMTDIEEYYERLMEIYGNDMSVLAVSPIWRGDNMEALPVFESFCAKVKEICKRYKNVKLVDGEKLVPHLPEYFLDNLHPNCHGCEVYGRNLVREIERLGF
ncbi:MAG: SGNH/GDSL hydrolase family protein, partial [Spirochaetaceae bacterium]|nr:SGNH/GDSL hydrolase family protein [Spirochaetaceae bacterium]